METNEQYGDNKTLAITAIRGRYGKTVAITLPSDVASALVEALRAGNVEVEGDRSVRIRIGILVASGTF